ncbi:MAG: hypothetical protein CBC38_02890 [Gammaproteobacteria bacterium TMED78]|nr:MAG: hypothetical protein CBC38_02890 [Gammaproteobacteria bacterium TMED78]
MEIVSIKTFFLWCSIINISLLIFSALIVIIFKHKIIPIHKSMFELEENDLKIVYMNSLGNYKVAIIILNIVPYLTLEYFI